MLEIKNKEMFAFNDKTFNIPSKEIERIISQTMKSTYGTRTLNKLVYQYFESMLFDTPIDEKEHCNVY